MPLVFVHGVSVRRETGYAEAERTRDALFRRFLLPGIAVDPRAATILNPYWGDYGAAFKWNHASLPAAGIEALGVDERLAALLLGETIGTLPDDTDAVLVQVARKSMPDVIDLLWASSAQAADETGAAELADLAVRAVDYARHNAQPPWLAAVRNDLEFLRELQTAVDAWTPLTPVGPENDTKAWEHLGFGAVWDRIRAGFGRLKDAASRLTGGAIVDLARSSVHRKAATFFGDVFVYLKERDNPAVPHRIGDEVRTRIEEARKRIKPGADDKTIVVAHSLGGIIVYDVLTRGDPALSVDVLVTVGSQVALFEELKLLAASDPDLPKNPRADRVARPRNVGKWINIFDYNDVLSFAAAGVFSGVQDFSFSTGKGVLGAHGGYFSRPSLHERLRNRLAGQPPDGSQ